MLIAIVPAVAAAFAALLLLLVWSARRDRLRWIGDPHGVAARVNAFLAPR